MDKPTKTVTKKIARGGDVRLPIAMVEENGLSKGAVDLYYGSNYSCAVVVPAGTRLGAIQKERISKLVGEPLTQER